MPLSILGVALFASGLGLAEAPLPAFGMVFTFVAGGDVAVLWCCAAYRRVRDCRTTRPGPAATSSHALRRSRKAIHRANVVWYPSLAQSH